MILDRRAVSYAPHRRRASPFTRTFLILLAAALAAALLPPSWTGWARGVTQLLVWMQAAPAAGSQAVHRLADANTAPTPSAEQFEQLQRRAEALERQVQGQSLRVEDLQRQVQQLTGLRGMIGDARTRLVPAAIVAYDASPRRHCVLIDRGSANTSADGRIRVDQWVVAAPLGDGLPAGGGRDLLERQWLIGRVIEVHAYVSRVQLASDPRFGPLKVRPARRLADGTLSPSQRECLLEGGGQAAGRGVGDAGSAGHAAMLIRGAPENFFESGYELVLVPRGPGLPVPMPIGRVIWARAIEHAPLVFDLGVGAIDDYSRLSDVFVVVGDS